jgi:uncharacterized integral membrane protein
MAWNARKIKVYGRLVFISLFVLIILIFIFSNSEKVEVKFFTWKTHSLPLYLLLLITANAGIGFYLVSRRIGKVIKDVRTLRHESRQQKSVVKEIKNEVEK